MSGKYRHGSLIYRREQSFFPGLHAAEDSGAHTRDIHEKVIQRMQINRDVVPMRCKAPGIRVGYGQLLEIFLGNDYPVIEPVPVIDINLGDFCRRQPWRTLRKLLNGACCYPEIENSRALIPKIIGCPDDYLVGARRKMKPPFLPVRLVKREGISISHKKALEGPATIS